MLSKYSFPVLFILFCGIGGWIIGCLLAMAWSH
jgi:hypothetical protein